VHHANISCPGRNHFSVLDDLCDPQSPVFESVLELAGR